LVRRHGPMVLGVCQRILGDVHAAEDAFQATFLALVRGANRLEHLSSWLYTVAYHAAVRARSDATRRRYEERQAVTMTTVQSMTDPVQTELRTVIDQELTRLPEKYRSPLVLCYLEGKTNEEAAELLGWTKGTVSGRLARARNLLNTRLTRRGFALGASGIGTLATTSTVSAALVDATVGTALLSITGQLAPAPLAALAEGALQSMAVSKLKITVAALLFVTTATMAGLLLCADARTPSSNSVVALTPLPDDDKGQLAEDVKVEFNANGEMLVAGRERPLSALEEIEDHLAKLFQQNAKADEQMTLVLRVPGAAETAVVKPLLRFAYFARIRLRTTDRPSRQSLPMERGTAPDLPQLTVIVTAANQEGLAGSLASVLVQTPTGERSLPDSESLETCLRQARHAADISDKENIFISAEDELKIADLIRLIDICRNSGFRYVHFVPPSSDDIDILHAEAKLKQAAIGVRLQRLEENMQVLAQRLEKSDRKEDQTKATVIKQALASMANAGAELHADKISEGLRQVLNLQRVRDLIDETDVLGKDLDAARSLITDANSKLKDDDLQAVEKELQKKVGDQKFLRKLLRRSELALYQLKGVTNPPKDEVKAKVTAVDAQSGQVTISAGKDVGLERGHTLEVYRFKPKPTYVGQLRIVEAKNNTAVGKMTLRRGSPAVDDDVSSDIPSEN
jgi:RNA polymerase sigma factor (sigma-70 family)